MDAKHSQKNVERLARVRENQRKSRARKQEYVRELEQRLANFKNEAQQKDIQHRLASQKLEAENRHLRTLLGSLGISPEMVQKYLQLADQGTAVNRKVAIPAMQRPAGLPVLSSPTSSETNPCSSSARASASSVCSTATDGSTTRDSGGTPNSYTSIAYAPSAFAPNAPASTNCAPTTCAPTTCASTTCASTTCAPNNCAPVKVEPEVMKVESEEPQLPQQPLQPSQRPSQEQPQQPSVQSMPANPSLCDCAPGDKIPEGEGDLLNTTLCGMAEELINQYNISGTDIEEIRRRLWAGFKAGTRGEGCRVENQVLFQVLDEISNSI
ncbi:hypothetical protein F1880_005194 [Penicillium rolfsii]|nr:hypothetical protein F1880_005194 [Penicillium rolfsii]